MKFGHVTYIETKTRVFHLVTSVLWNYLGESSVDPVQITSLLYQLHNCLDSGLVETVIGNRMYARSMQQQFAAADALSSRMAFSNNFNEVGALNNYRIDRAAELRMICISPVQAADITADQLKESESQSFKKFELLWHLGREKQPSKGFEKTLLKVLDTLSLPYYMSAKTFVTKWLQSSLLRGDISRLIKPLYKILLSPNSRRIGIVHMHLMKKEGETSVSGGDTSNQKYSSDMTTEVDSIEQDVYAISSEFGNVKYHLDSSTNKKRSPMRNFQKKLFGVTLSSKNKTSNFLSDKSTPTVPSENDSNIGVIVNPLNNSPDFETQSEEFNNCNKEIVKEVNSSDQEHARELEANSFDENDDCDDSNRRTYYLSSEDSESSAFDTESENRDTSVEKDESLISGGGSVGNLKRFVGDCDQVTDLLSQHDKTKNRKTYHLTRAASEVIEKVVESSAGSVNVVDGKIIEREDTAHPADEYFSGGASAEGSSGESVETFVNDLVDRVASAEPDLIPSQQRFLKKKGITKKKKNSPSSAQITEKLRMSCISKMSTDSNSSVVAGRSSNDERETTDTEEVGCSEEEDVFQKSEDKSQSTTISQTCSVKTTNTQTINVEDKRRSLSLETTKTKTTWDLTQETLEKGKENVKILRQNVAVTNIEGSKRSSTTSSQFNGSRKSQINKVRKF